MHIHKLCLQFPLLLNQQRVILQQFLYFSLLTQCEFVLGFLKLSGDVFDVGFLFFTHFLSSMLLLMQIWLVNIDAHVKLFDFLF